MLWKHRVSLEKTPFLSRGLPTVTRGQSKTMLFRYLQCGMDRAFKTGKQSLCHQVFFSGEHAAEYLLISNKSKETLATPWSLLNQLFSSGCSACIELPHPWNVLCMPLGLSLF